MKIDAIAALLRHKNGNPPQEALEAAAFEALDMVVSVVESMRRIADVHNGRDALILGLGVLSEGERAEVMQTVLHEKYGLSATQAVGHPAKIAYDALGRLVDL